MSCAAGSGSKPGHADSQAGHSFPHSTKGVMMIVKTVSKVYLALIFLFLYAPIFVLIFFSFNASNSTSLFEGFSLRWYASLFQDKATLQALYNSLLLAVASSLAATVLGTAAAVGIDTMRKKWLKTSVLSVTNIPMMNPEIVTGISMMLLFVFGGKLLGVRDVLGFWTLLFAHITFNLPYVILSILPKLRQMDPHLYEAAQDLGCPPARSFFKVVLPGILPGIVTGFVMAFTMSLDDFIISYFTNGPSFQTLPVRIYSMTKRRVTPDIYALFTLIFLAILVLLILYNIAQAKGEKRMNKKFAVKGD